MEESIKKIKYSVDERAGKTINSKVLIATHHGPPRDMTSLTT